MQTVDREKSMPPRKCQIDAGVRLLGEVAWNQVFMRTARSEKAIERGSAEGRKGGVRLSWYLSVLESEGWRGVRRNCPDQYGGIATRSRGRFDGNDLEKAELP